ARTQISKLSKKETESFKEQILSMSTTEEVVQFVKETFNLA
ncbi:hypothetical protein ABWW12_21275, partial [Bacillus subtilis]